MKPIEVTLVVYKETPGAIHYKAPNPEGKPVSDVYIRKVHFNGAKPPQRITVLVTAEESRLTENASRSHHGEVENAQVNMIRR